MVDETVDIKQAGAMLVFPHPWARCGRKTADSGWPHSVGWGSLE